MGSRCITTIRYPHEETSARYYSIIFSKRKDKNLPFRSDDLIPQVAKQILENTHFTVDLDHYDVGLIIEMDSKFTYIMGKIYQGAKGYPVGVSGKAMLLL